MSPKDLKGLLVGLEVSVKRGRAAKEDEKPEEDEDLKGRELLAKHKLSKKQVEAFAQMHKAGKVAEQKSREVAEILRAAVSKRERVWEELKTEFPDLKNRFGHYNDKTGMLEVYGPKKGDEDDEKCENCGEVHDQEEGDDEGFSLKDLLSALSE